MRETKKSQIAVIAISFFVLFVCASLKSSSPPPVKRVSTFKKYVDEFMQLAESHGYATETIARVKIRFGSPPQMLAKPGTHNVGYCYPDFVDGFRVIEIDRSHWDRVSDNCRRALVWHEMGHCALNKRHTEKGLMRPQTNCDATSEEDFVYMLDGPTAPFLEASYPTLSATPRAP